MNSTLYKSLFAYIISCIFIVCMMSISPSWKKTGGGATLSWDVMGYYTYLPAALIYKDLADLKFREDIQNKYHPTGLDHAGYLSGNGNHIMKYPMGMAIAYSPWFLMAHITSYISGYPPDGYSRPYNFFIAFGCLFYAFVGLWYFRKILLRYFDDGVSAITLLLIALGTNYLNYSAFDMAMPHNFLFTLYAILVWNTIKWYEEPSTKRSIIIGICIGWTSLARPTELVSILIPILWGLSNWESILDRFVLWKKNFGKLFLTGCIIAVIGLLQIIYWKIYAGKFLEYSYQEQGFSWDGRHLRNCFFSYRKGWLLYTPLMAFSIFGFVFYWLKNNTFTFSEKNFWAIFIFFLINTYIIFSWDIWWYGGGYGQRAMIPSYLLLALPLAALIEFISKNIFSKIVVGTMIFAAAGLNIFQTYQAHIPTGGFETENMTKTYYWKIFGKTNIDPEWRILLDTDEEYLEERKDIVTIFTRDFEEAIDADSTQLNSKFASSGNQSLYLSKEVQYSPKFKMDLNLKGNEKEWDWIRAHANFYETNKEWNYWMMSQFIISIEQDDKIIKEKMIRVQRLLGINDWRKIHIDIKIPKDETFNNVKVKFWNAGGNKELWIDDLQIEMFKE